MELFAIGIMGFVLGIISYFRTRPHTSFVACIIVGPLGSLYGAFAFATPLGAFLAAGIALLLLINLSDKNKHLPSPIKWAFGYTVFWGSMVVISSLLALMKPHLSFEELPPFAVTAVKILTGIGMVVLAFAVRNCSRVAAWGLAALGFFLILAMLLQGEVAILLPLILLATSLHAAIYLHKHRKNRIE